VRLAARRRAGLALALALAVSGGVAAAAVILAPAARAHAVLVSSTPVDGSRVSTQPVQVRLTFDEPVGLIPADEQVISATGARADTARVRLANGGTTIVLPLKPNLPRGTYSATWRVVSADTHVVTGSITFGLGVQPGAGVAAAPDHTGQLDATADVAEGLIYAGLVLLAGITACWPGYGRGPAAVALGAAIAPGARRGLGRLGGAGGRHGRSSFCRAPGPSTPAGPPSSGCATRAAR
jgi:copper transport protein